MLLFVIFIVVKYYIEVHTSEAEMTAATNANVFITLYGSQSDSGRRHLIHSKDSKKRFQAGQVSTFGVQCNPSVMLCLGSIGMDCVVSESCYRGTILQWNYRKITILWSFS